MIIGHRSPRSIRPIRHMARKNGASAAGNEWSARGWRTDENANLGDQRPGDFGDRAGGVGHRRPVAIRLGARSTTRNRSGRSAAPWTRASTGSTPPPSTAWAIPRRWWRGRWRAGAVRRGGDQVRPVWDESGQVRRCSRPESIRREAEDSLRRLRTSRHRPLPDPLARSRGAPGRELGGHGAAAAGGQGPLDRGFQLQPRGDPACHAIHPASLQPQYSLLRRAVEADLLPWCGKAGVGIVAYSPMASGLLTGSFDIGRLAPDDWRREGKFFQEPVFSRRWNWWSGSVPWPPVTARPSGSWRWPGFCGTRR